MTSKFDDVSEMGRVLRNHWRRLIDVAVVLLILCVWFFWPGRTQDKFDHGPQSLLNKRPSIINRSRITEYSLLLNDQPFADRHHTLVQGASVHCTGHFVGNASEIPVGAWPEFLVSLRPVDVKGPEDDWDVDELEKYYEWRCTPLGEERVIDMTREISGKYLLPGEYHARLYLLTDDREFGHNTVDLIETAKVTILPAKAQTVP